MSDERSDIDILIEKFENAVIATTRTKGCGAFERKIYALSAIERELKNKIEMDKQGEYERGVADARETFEP